MLFLFRKLSVDFRHFWAFVFCHKAYSKTRKPRKIFISSFFEVLKLFIWSTFLSILCSLFTNFFFKELNRHLQFSKLSGIISWNSITGSLILYLVSFLSKIFPFQNVCKRTDFLQFKFFQYPKTLLLFYLMCLLQLQMSILICATQTLHN